MDDATFDRRPGKWLGLYIPLVLGLLTGVLTDPACRCTWMQLLGIKASSAVIGFVVWWIILSVGYHGYHFLRSLFHHPR
jgi:hypothetical protein